MQYSELERPSQNSASFNTYGGKVGGIEQNELFDGIQYGG